MKRRDFLISATVFGTAFPHLTSGQTKPCPPSVVATGSSSTTTPCAAGNAPSWFTAMPDRTWKTIAGAAGQTLHAVRPDPLPPGNDGHAAVCNNWTGGCVDQERGQFILPTNGGHQGYSGNEIYALSLRDETPAWKRIWGPSSLEAIRNETMGFNSRAQYGDGAPSASHTFNRPVTDSSGNIWLAGIDSMYDMAGNWSTATYSFSRATQSWTYHGIGAPAASSSEGSYKFLGGSACYDPVEHKVWSIAQYGFAYTVHTVDCATGALQAYSLPGSNLGKSWSVIIPERRLLVVAHRVAYGDVRLKTLDLNNPTAGFTSRTVTGSPGDVKDRGVYHAPSNAIFAWHDNGASILKLTVPSSVSGTWAWSSVSPASANTVTPSAAQSQGTYGRFNLIEDMGNGQSSLVLVNRTTEPVYVYKLPLAGA